MHYNRLDGSTWSIETPFHIGICERIARVAETIVYDIVDGCFAFLMFCLALFAMCILYACAIEIFSFLFGVGNASMHRLSITC